MEVLKLLLATGKHLIWFYQRVQSLSRIFDTSENSDTFDLEQEKTGDVFESADLNFAFDAKST